MKISTHSAYAMRVWGQVFLESGQLDAALGALESAASAVPNSGEYQIAFGAALSRANRIAEAEEVLARGVKLSPQSIYGHAELIRVLARRGRIESAIAQLHKAVVQAVNHNAYLELGQVLINAICVCNGDGNEEHQNLDAAYGYRVLSQYFNEYGMIREAITAARCAVLLKPQSEEFRSSLHELRNDLAGG